MYGALTAIIVGVYALVAGGLGTLVQARGTPLVSVLAAGLVAALFAPLRERLQRAVNRLLYGDRDEPYTAIARLGQRLEGVIVPEAVFPTIVQTVRDGLKLPYVAVEVGTEVVAQAGLPVGRETSSPCRSPTRARQWAGWSWPRVRAARVSRRPTAGYSTTWRGRPA